MHYKPNWFVVRATELRTWYHWVRASLVRLSSENCRTNKRRVWNPYQYPSRLVSTRVRPEKWSRSKQRAGSMLCKFTFES
ncbi:hypothetical protein KSS87_022037, partial [Heliosperma pusillum]